MLEFHRHLGLRVFAHRHRLHAKVTAHRRDAGQLLDRQKNPVDRAVAGRDRRRLRLAVLEHAEGDGRGRPRLARERVALVDELLREGGELLLAERRDVAVVDLLLAVGEQLEPLEDRLQLLRSELVAERLRPVGERGPATVLAKHEVGAFEPHVLRPHDFVGARLLEHAILVDARLVGKGVLPHDRLVSRHLDAGDVGHQPAGRHKLLCDDPRGAMVVVAPRAKRHHHFLERAVARPLAEAVDRALDLAGPRLDGRQAVGHGEAEVVVAVGADHRLVDVRHAVHQALDHTVHVRGRGVTDGVGNVHRCRARGNHRLDHAAEEVDLGAGRVLGRELDVSAVAPRPRHAGDGAGEHLRLGHPQLELTVDRTGREKHVDPGLLRGLERFPGPVDVGVVAASQAADPRALHHLRDLTHALEVARRCDREAGLDHVHPEQHERLGDLQFLGEVHARPGRLLAVAERGVEDADWAGRGHRKSSVPGSPSS